MSLGIIHNAINSAVSSVLERRPAFGWLFGAASSGSGLWALVEAGTKIGGLVSVLIGIAIGVYTLRIQRRTWKKAQDEDAKK